jgi:hypothetical protein
MILLFSTSRLDCSQPALSNKREIVSAIGHATNRSGSWHCALVQPVEPRLPMLGTIQVSYNIGVSRQM